MTLTDPVAFTKPWVVTKTYERLKEKDVRAYDYACAENNRNPVDEHGRTITLDQNGKRLHD